MFLVYIETFYYRIHIFNNLVSCSHIASIITQQITTTVQTSIPTTTEKNYTIANNVDNNSSPTRIDKSAIYETWVYMGTLI